MKNKFRIVGIIAGLFSLCNFSSSANMSFSTTNSMGALYKSNFNVCPSNAVCKLSNLGGAGNGTYLVSVLNNGVLEYQTVDRNGLLSLGNGTTYFNIIAIDSKQSFSVTNGGTLTLGEVVTCPEINTGEILSGYVLESSIDNEYCELNNLCPVYTGDSGNDLSGVNWSLLYINDIQHIGAGIINITIPEEINRDYIYTGNGDQFDLNVSGYNVDSAYIDGIITTQKTLPNSIDFNNVVSVIIPKLIPGLVIILFLLFIFRFIKKIF